MEMGFYQPVRIIARDGYVEKLTLSQVPGGVEPHRQPQPASEQISGCEQDSALEHDPNRRQHVGLGIFEVRQAE